MSPAALTLSAALAVVLDGPANDNGDSLGEGSSGNLSGMKRLRKRYGHTGGRGGKRRGVPSHVTLERASEDAQRNANATRTPWVVVYRPRDGSHWDYSLTTLRRTPISEPHEIVATLYPRGWPGYNAALVADR